MVEGVPYTLSGADTDLNSQSAGGNTNDFTGLGAAISAYGEGTVLAIENSDIETSGVVKPALYISGGAGGLYELTLSVADLDNQVDAVTVDSCTAVDWNGGDIDLAAANNTTVYLLLPKGADVNDLARAGESLGIGAKEFEGQYFGSFHVPGQGLWAEPLDIY